ncbi:MAG TPA: hypothetical protein VMV29_14285, partial [Ktedonobacterales bacterium]|nr:hypothetical protein [Ktedonobacterales bacterium]
TTVATGPIVDADPADEWGRDDLPPADTADVTADTPFKPTPLADAITQRGQSRPPIAARPPTTKRVVKAPRVLTPDEQYRVDLLAALAEARGGKEGNHGADWKAAGAFCALSEGTPPIEHVVAWYREEMQRPKWDTGYPDLHQLTVGAYRAYVRSAENYRQAIVRARLAADGKLGQQGDSQGDSHATTPRAYGSHAYAGRAARRSAAAQPDPHKDGIYAAFVD